MNINIRFFFVKDSIYVQIFHWISFKGWVVNLDQVPEHSYNLRHRRLDLCHWGSTLGSVDPCWSPIPFIKKY